MLCSPGLTKTAVIKILTTISILILPSALTSCSFLDKTAQDRAACDKLSELILNDSNYLADSGVDYSSVLSGLGASGNLSAAGEKLEQEVLPLASMEFGSDIKKLVNYLKKTGSTSIFDVAASYSYGIDLLTQVVGHCVLVSREK